MGKSFPKRDAAGSARHAAKKHVRTYPMNHQPKRRRPRSV